MPEAEEKEIEVPLKNTGVLIDEKVSDKDKFIKEFNFLNFLEEDEKKKVAEVIYELSVNKYKRNHKVIVEYKNKKKEERREERKANYFNPYYNIHNYVEKGYFANVSKTQKDKCMKIVSAIYFAIEDREMVENREKDEKMSKSTEKTENRQTIIRNKRLNDLIRILILRELLGRPGFTGFPGGRPPRPPMRPPLPPMRPPIGPPPRPQPRPGGMGPFNRSMYGQFDDLYEY